MGLGWLPDGVCTKQVLTIVVIINNLSVWLTLSLRLMEASELEEGRTGNRNIQVFDPQTVLLRILQQRVQRSSPLGGGNIMSWDGDLCSITPGYFLPKFRLPREYQISGYIFNFPSRLAWSRLDLWKTAGFMWLFLWLLPKASHLRVFVAWDQLLSTSAALWKSWKCDRFADKHILYLMCIIFLQW